MKAKLKGWSNISVKRSVQLENNINEEVVNMDKDAQEQLLIRAVSQ